MSYAAAAIRTYVLIMPHSKQMFKHNVYDNTDLCYNFWSYGIILRMEFIRNSQYYYKYVLHYRPFMIGKRRIAMTEIAYFILFAAGLLMVVKGSDWFVGSAVWAAQAFRIPPIIIGATIVSICTTLPETFVSATAALKGEMVMAVGNSLGSIGVNAGFILAVLIMYTRPEIENRKEFLKNGLFLALLLLALWAAGFLYGDISRPMGVGLILLLVVYILNNVISARKLMDLDIRYDIINEDDAGSLIDPYSSMPEGIVYDEKENDFNVSLQQIIKKILFFCFGVFFVVMGSGLLVDNGINIALLLKVPNFLISIIFTSVGTSLPELITVIASIRKGVSNLGIGNIIGANILNILQVIGITALLHPIPVAAEKSILLFQLPVLLLMVISIICFGLFGKGRLSKRGGLWLLVLYLFFLSVNLLRETAPVLGPILF